MIRQLENAISATKRSLLGTSLKGRFLRSSLIMSVGVVISKGFGFASKVILTRLLFPQEIGLMVMIIALAGFFEVLAEVGVKQSIIQNRNRHAEVLDAQLIAGKRLTGNYRTLGR